MCGAPKQGGALAGVDLTTQTVIQGSVWHDGTFKSDDELKELYAEENVDLAKDTIAYCRIGERSALTWFVLHELLGVENVKNYDGSWTEYGSLVGVPIELGAAK